MQVTLYDPGVYGYVVSIKNTDRKRIKVVSGEKKIIIYPYDYVIEKDVIEVEFSFNGKGAWFLVFETRGESNNEG